MSMWRCPHCGTPQPESSRCWVCHRSSTTCSTCRNFRRGVAGQLGYCGLERRRLPLAGTELKGCWERAASRAETPPVRAATHEAPGPADPASRLRDFVPVELRRDGRIVVGARQRRDPAEHGRAEAGGAQVSRPALLPGAFGEEGPGIPASTVSPEQAGARLTLFGEVDLTGS